MYNYRKNAKSLLFTALGLLCSMFVIIGLYVRYSILLDLVVGIIAFVLTVFIIIFLFYIRKKRSTS